MRVGTVLMLALVLAGCGGGDKAAQPKPQTVRDAGGQEAGLNRTVRGVRPADLAAFYQVATATGSLRRWAAVARFRRSGSGVRRSELRGALARLRKVRPVDPVLRRTRRRALRALASAAAVAHPSRAVARLGLRRADKLTAVLHRLVRADPRFSALTPD